MAREAPNLVPPQEPPIWTDSPADIREGTKQAIAAAKAGLDAIAALPAKDCTFESVFEAIQDIDTKLSVKTEPYCFYQNVSTDKEVRDASTDAEQMLNDYGVESEMRVDVFKAKTHAKTNIQESGVKLSPEQERLVEKSILQGTRAGLALSDDKRAILEQKKKALAQKCLEFNRNFNEEKGFITFTLAELDGIAPDVISGYKKHENEDAYDVTFKTPDLLPIYKFAKNPETRKKALIGSEGRLALNAPLLDEILVLRRELADILGYATWADYITEVKMVKSADNVTKFLDDLKGRLTPVGQQDRKNLLKLKEEECKSLNIPFDNEFYLWDYRYYDRLFVETTLDLDDKLVKEYFPVDVVVPVILDIYQELLGVKFFPFEGTAWHPEVQQLTVWEANATDSNGFVGYCYLDLYPRESKYSHAAVWGLIPGYDLPDGRRHYPLAAMVANLAKPTPDRPALMTHDDVVTFFHEMGHVFHGLLSRTRYARFHGTNVARDFVEAPSQMLENWCWEPEVLKKMSSHYKTKEPLSDDLIKKIIKSRHVNVGLTMLRQLFFATFDLKLHTDKESCDVTKLWNSLRQEISLVKGPDKPEPGHGSFSHLTGGYDAGYYGYLFSLVAATDMYSAVFAKNCLSPAAGKRYRDSILVPGGSREESDSLKEFLGRPPNSDAFLKEIFGKEAVAVGPKM